LGRNSFSWFYFVDNQKALFLGEDSSGLPPLKAGAKLELLSSMRKQDAKLNLTFI